MRSLVVVVPGDLETRTGGYGYDRRIIAGLRGRGWSVDVQRLDDSFPHPSSAARTHAAHVLAAIPDGTTVIVDGLACGALPDEIAVDAARLEIVALVHHPLAAETGLDPHVAAELEASERRALAASRFVVATSRTTAAALAGYGVESDQIAVVEPGTDPAPLARSSRPSRLRSPDDSASYGEPRQSAEGATAATIGHEPSAIGHQPLEAALLCVATVIPRKGHDLLFRALASIPHRNWRLICAGSTERDPATVQRLRAQLAADRIDDRVELVGDLDAATLAVQYDRADVFVLPTWYEGYGMAVAEAVARGLPVVSTATGGIEELLLGRGFAGSSTGGASRPAGVVVPPGDLGAFTAALSRVLGDARLRDELAAGARQVRDRLPTWDEAAAAMERVLDRVARR